MGPKQAALGCWGLALVALLAGCQEWISPGVAPQAAKAAWLHAYCTELFGPRGPAIGFFGFAALLWAIGILGWIGHQRGARR